MRSARGLLALLALGALACSGTEPEPIPEAADATEPELASVPEAAEAIEPLPAPEAVEATEPEPIPVPEAVEAPTSEPELDRDVEPYREEAVEFESGDITLSGTLTVPPGNAPHPAVVLVSGSGAQTRDYWLGSFPFFKVMADHLARHGIAALRYDDPGGTSADGFLQATIGDRAGTVAAAAGLLAEHAEIRPDMIGIIGHSEGGTVAPLAASQSDNVAFLVLLAGTGLPGDEISRSQTEMILRVEGRSEEDIAAALDRLDRIQQVVAAGTGWNEAESEVHQQVLAAIAALPESQQVLIADDDAYIEAVVSAQMTVLQSPWSRSFLAYDPGPALAETALPVLAVFGELDVQVPAEPNAAAVDQALEEAGNPDYTVIVLPGVNHLFQSAETGSVSEYVLLEAGFAPGFLDAITDWISGRVREA